MKNILAAFVLVGLLAGFSVADCRAGTVSSIGVRPSVVGINSPGLYAVAQNTFAEESAPVADVTVASESRLQLVIITTFIGACRAVLSDADGQILRSRAVDGELEVDFYTMPTGTYHIAILDASGMLQMKHTVVKR